MSKLTASDEIQDFLEYLVHVNRVRDLRDLSREEWSRLSLLYLIENNMYTTMIRGMHTILKSEVARFDRIEAMSTT